MKELRELTKHIDNYFRDVWCKTLDKNISDRIQSSVWGVGHITLNSSVRNAVIEELGGVIDE